MNRFSMIVLLTTLLLPAAALAQRPAVRTASPDAIELAAGERGQVVLTGQDLGALDRATVLARGRPVAGLRATLDRPGRDSRRRTVVIQADRSARPVKELELAVYYTDRTRRSQRVDTPVRIAVVGPSRTPSVARARTPSVARATPSRVTLGADADRATIQLTGKNLGAVTGVMVHTASGKPTTALTGSLRPGRDSDSALLAIARKGDPAPGAYVIVARWARGELQLPIRLEVEAPPAFPDLRFVSCSFDPPQPETSDRWGFEVIVENAGNAPAVWPATGGGHGVFIIQSDPPGVPGYVTNVPQGTTILPGGTRTLNGGPIGEFVVEPGEYTISGELDYLNRITESDEANNGFTCPTVTILPPSSLADLVVSDVQYEKSLWQAGGAGDDIEKLRLRVTITNQGDHEAKMKTGSAGTPIAGEGNTALSLAGSSFFGIVQPGETREYQLIAPDYEPGATYEGVIRVDPYDGVVESDEENNEFPYSYTIPEE